MISLNGVQMYIKEWPISLGFYKFYYLRKVDNGFVAASFYFIKYKR